MKSFFAIAAAAAVAVVAADECDLAKLLPLLQNDSVKACSAATNWQPPIPPTEAQYPAVCIDSCKAALVVLEGLGLGNCSIRNTIFLETSLIKPVRANCKWDGGAAAPTPASTTKAPTPATPTAPGTPTSAPTPASTVPSTKKPVC